MVDAGSGALPRRLLVSLYLVAGIPLGLLADVVPVYLRAEGLSLRDIGLFGAIHLPYSLKVLWGPLIDHTGHVRRWLLSTAALVGASYLALARVGPHAHPTRFAACCLLMTGASALYDVALDASFVRLLAGRGPAADAQANALRLSSFKLAMVTTGGGALVLGGTLRFTYAFAAMAAVHLVLLCAVPWRQLAQPPRAAAKLPLGDYFFGLWRWLRAPHVLRAFGLVFFYKFSLAALMSLERAFWTDRGLTPTTLGLVGAVAGIVSTVGGAAAGSLLAHRWGLGTMLVLGVAAQMLAALGYAGLACLPASLVALAVGLMVSGATFGLSTAALMSLITRLCRAQHAATQFAALTGTYALTKATAGALGGAVAQQVGYTGFFVAAAALGMPALMLVPGTLRAMARV